MKTLANESSVKDLVAELALEEKVNFLTTVTACITWESRERNIFPFVLEDGATGVNGNQIVLDYLALMKEKAKKAPAEQANNQRPQENPFVELPALMEMEADEAGERAAGNPLYTGFLEFMKERCNPSGRFVSFPSGVNIGACFDEKTAENIGRAVGEELRACGVSVCLGPNVDIMRDPLGGRNYEMYGEDPVLVERTAAAFIKGMQSAGTMACAKHFIANNQESNRETKNTHVSLRTLKELYARGFRAAVKEGGVKSVMSAYNAVNGTFSSYNKMILTDWLKKEWGFDGFVVSDWGAVTGRNDRAIAAGMDLIMHGGFTRGDGKDIIEAVENGSLAEERIDDALERILRAVLWLDEAKKAVPLSYDQDRLLEAAYRTNVEGMVLLKNNGVLPLAAGTHDAFAGTRAVHTMECGSGSTYVTTPLHGNLTEECGKFGIVSTEFDSCDIVIYAAGAEGGENVDRPSMTLDQEDDEQIADVLRKAKQAGKKTAVVLNIAGPVDMRNWISDADAIVCEFVPGCTGARARFGNRSLGHHAQSLCL